MNTPRNIDDQRFLELLEKWLRGDFTRADERAMEALAASDDFRREAWEGFQNLPEEEHRIRLQALRDRLRPPAAMRAMTRALIATAASMALIAAAVWILQPHGETSDVAMKTETRGDTVLFEPQPAASDPIAQAPVSATTPGRGQAEIRPGGPDVALKQAPVRAITKQDEAADIVLMESASENREMAYQSSGPEEDAAVAAPPPVSAVQEEAGKTYQDDRLAMPQGTPNQMPQAKPAVKETEAPQNQSVETAAASKTKRAESKKKAAPTPSKSEPAGGWKAWDLYVQNNRRYTEEARLAGIEGKVVINFLVDENNQPGYFVVKTPLGYGLDEEALRLVRGFAWVRGKDPQVRVEVVFKL